MHARLLCLAKESLALLFSAINHLVVRSIGREWTVTTFLERLSLVRCTSWWNLPMTNSLEKHILLGRFLSRCVLTTCSLSIQSPSFASTRSRGPRIVYLGSSCCG